MNFVVCGCYPNFSNCTATSLNYSLSIQHCQRQRNKKQSSGCLWDQKQEISFSCCKVVSSKRRIAFWKDLECFPSILCNNFNLYCTKNIFALLKSNPWHFKVLFCLLRIKKTGIVGMRNSVCSAKVLAYNFSAKHTIFCLGVLLSKKEYIHVL